MNDDPLKTSVQFLRGVGPERARLLANLGIVTVEDLLWNLPRDVLDLTNVCPAARLRTGELQTVRGTVVDIDGRTTGNGRTLVAVLLESDGTYVQGVWFNQPWSRQQIGEPQPPPRFGRGIGEVEALVTSNSEVDPARLSGGVDASGASERSTGRPLPVAERSTPAR